MVIHFLHATVEMKKCGDILACAVMDQITGFEVEMGSVKVVRFLKVSNAAAKMPKLIHHCRTRFESLGFIHISVLVVWEVVVKLSWSRGHFLRCLAKYQVEREPIHWVVKCYSLPTSGRIDIVDIRGPRQYARRQLQIVDGLNYKSCATEGVLITLGGAVNKRLSTKTFIVYPVICLVCHLEAEIEHKLVRCLEVRVVVVHMRDSHKVDPWSCSRRHVWALEI